MIMSENASPQKLDFDEEVSTTSSSRYKQDVDHDLSVSVTDYYSVGDANSYDKHFFIMEVLVEKQKFAIDRSYLDFVEFDRRLRKKFPRSKLPKLPLDAAKVLTAGLLHELANRKKIPIGGGVHTSTRNSLVFTTDSIISSPTYLSPNNPTKKTHPFRVVTSYDEDIPRRQSYLNRYLESLFSMHEVLMSEELQHFLDEEISSMTETTPQEPLSVHDILLFNVPSSKVTVRVKEEYTFMIPPKHLILWRFATVGYDIGFSVELNGQERIPYTRNKSHEHVVVGTLEGSLTDTSKCVLKWDNSYAKLHTKALTWSARVVAADDFQAAKEQALEVQREKKRFEQQRYAVKRRATRQAAMLSGVIYGSTVVAEHNEEESGEMSRLENEVVRLSEEMSLLVQDLHEAGNQNELLCKQNTAAEIAKSALDAEWRAAVLHGKTVESKLLLSQQENEDLMNQVDDLTANITALDEYVEASGKTLTVTEQCLRDARHQCQKALASADVELEEMAQQSTAREQNLQDIEDEQLKVGSLTNPKAVMAAKDNAIALLSNLANDLLDELATCRVAIEDRNATIAKTKEILEFSLGEVGVFRERFSIATPTRGINQSASVDMGDQY